ncbi:hypothetical protein H8356DRAFT_1652740 [Neocallimastix lanati (nom. inval.)]|nr:hypothetical protein H8356DRAFT_1652740 [Neocallimastix sp. JGI-2020a]
MLSSLSLSSSNDNSGSSCCFLGSTLHIYLDLVNLPFPCFECDLFFFSLLLYCFLFLLFDNELNLQSSLGVSVHFTNVAVFSSFVVVYEFLIFKKFFFLLKPLQFL